MDSSRSDRMRRSAPWPSSIVSGPGQTLAASTFSGGAATCGGAADAGPFTWKTPSTPITAPGTYSEGVTYTPLNTKCTPGTTTVNVTAS